MNFWNDPLSHPLFPLYVVTTFVFIVILLVMFVTLYVVRILNLLTQQALRESAARQGIPYKPKPSWWDRFTQRMNASVAVEDEKNIEMDHEYDGIKELDNHLPPWWKWLFYGTIVWAGIYVVVFHLSDNLPLQTEEYNQEIALAEERALRLKASQPQAVVDESTLEFTADAELIEKGKAVFVNNNCGACHRADGGGNSIGPNLTDTYWIHGGGIKNVFHTIKNGAVDKGMPAWGKVMSDTDVKHLAFFVMSLQGTNPANAKAPQGEIFKEAQTVVAATDSTKAQASL